MSQSGVIMSPSNYQPSDSEKDLDLLFMPRGSSSMNFTNISVILQTFYSFLFCSALSYKEKIDGPILPMEAALGIRKLEMFLTYQRLPILHAKWPPLFQ